MAKIKFGSIITDSRGTVGGHSFTWSRYGNQIITKPQTAKLRTARQTLVRANFELLSKRWWSVLTPTERTDWRALAAANPRPNTWGDDFPLTGLALYISLNRLLDQAGLSTIDTAPADQTVTPPATATLTLSAPNVASLAFTPTPVPTDHVAYLKITPPLSPGISNFETKLYFLDVSGSGQTSPWNISAALLSRFGNVITGRQYAAQLAFLNTTNAALSAGVIAPAIAT